ncbi:MAG: hypothetical protein QF515_19200, partial [Pseudomonadales bacterium]|nr:hypothetical protein [Pseudomonadales bacterium]
IHFSLASMLREKSLSQWPCFWGKGQSARLKAVELSLSESARLVTHALTARNPTRENPTQAGFRDPQTGGISAGSFWVVHLIGC